VAATPTAAAATATATASAVSATPTTEVSTPPSTEPTASASAETSAPPSNSATIWKVGVVTDVGTIDDKNFNQYSYEGAKLGAHNIGAADPQYVVPKDASD
jgi:basic membrane protein A